jgi:hypothetical protein
MALAALAHDALVTEWCSSSEDGKLLSGDELAAANLALAEEIRRMECENGRLRRALLQRSTKRPEAPNFQEEHAKSPSASQRHCAIGGESRCLEGSPATCEPAQRTSVVVRNIPTEFSRDHLVKLFDETGFSGAYNFLHMPLDFHTRLNFGYCFLNLTNNSEATRFLEHFDGHALRDAVDGSLEVTWSTTQQGLDDHIQQHRNSTLMHESVPDCFKPALWQNGFRVPFPSATRKIRAPRFRRNKHG